MKKMVKRYSFNIGEEERKAILYINVSFVLVVSVILNIIFGHGITSLVSCFVLCYVPFYTHRILAFN